MTTQISNSIFISNTFCHQHAFFVKKNLQGCSCIQLKKFDLIHALWQLFGLVKENPKILGIVEYFKACLKIDEFSLENIKEALREELKRIDFKSHYINLVKENDTLEYNYHTLALKIKKNIQFLLKNYFNCNPKEIHHFQNVLDTSQKKNFLKITPFSIQSSEITYKSGKKETVLIENNTAHKVTILCDQNKNPTLLIDGKFALVKNEITFENSPNSIACHPKFSSSLISFGEKVKQIKISKSKNEKERFTFSFRYSHDKDDFYDRNAYLPGNSQDTPNFQPFHPQTLTLKQANQKRTTLSSKMRHIKNSPFYKLNPKLIGHKKFLEQIDHLKFTPQHVVIPVPSGKTFAFLFYDPKIAYRVPSGRPSCQKFPHIIYLNNHRCFFSDNDACYAVYSSRDANGKKMMLLSSCDVDKEDSYSKKPTVVLF